MKKIVDYEPSEVSIDSLSGGLKVMIDKTNKRCYIITPYITLRGNFYSIVNTNYIKKSDRDTLMDYDSMPDIYTKYKKDFDFYQIDSLQEFAEQILKNNWS